MNLFPEPCSALFRRKFPDHILHWISSLAIVLYAVASQYIYALSDKSLLPDHDPFICLEIFQSYNSAPFPFVLSSFYDFILNSSGTSAFVKFAVSVCFFVFGRTLFVFKMWMVSVAIAIGIGVYFLVFLLTRKSHYGIAASAVVLNMPVTVEILRKQFSYLPLAAVCVAAVFIVVRDIRLNNRLNCLLLAACLWVGFCVHCSALIYFFFILAYLLFRKKNGVHYSLLLGLYILLCFMKLPWLLGWLSYKISFGESMGGSVVSPDLIAAVKHSFHYIGEAGSDIILPGILALCVIYLFQRIAVFKKRNRLFPEASGGSGFVIFMFFCALAANICSFAIMGSVPSYTYVFMFILAVIVFFLLLRLVSGRSVFLSACASVCVLLFSWYVLYKYDFAEFKSFKDSPILLDEQETERNMLRFTSDMEDVTGLLRFLSGANKACPIAPELAILRCGMVLYDDDNGVNAGRLYHLLNYWDESMGFEGIYSIQAFYEGIGLSARNIIMLVDRSYAPPSKVYPWVDQLWDDGIKERYERQFQLPIKADYVFLSVLKKCADKNELWNIADEQIIIDAIRRGDVRVYDRFFRNAKFMAKMRMHNNLYLYVFRILYDKA